MHQGDAQDGPTFEMEHLTLWEGLFSAYACSLDPTIRLSSLPAVEDDNATVVTSNVTQIAHSHYTKQYGSTHPLIAATTQHLLGNALPQYLNKSGHCGHWSDVNFHHERCEC